jgi:hypothetical protein
MLFIAKIISIPKSIFVELKKGPPGAKRRAGNFVADPFGIGPF